MCERVRACARAGPGLHRSSSGICVIINHAHTPCLGAVRLPPLLFYGLTCHDRGMTATLSEREGRKWGEGGDERCGFGVDRVGREGEAEGWGEK